MPLILNALPLSTVVKEATQLLHTEVENLLLPKLVSISHTEHYAAILKMFYGYFQPLEQRIQCSVPVTLLPDVHERRKAASILHDLKQIGFPASAIPLCEQLPRITTTAEAFGALYVLEGSTLGGRVITKMLLKNTACSISENALTFFAGYGEETGSKWKTFLYAFNQQHDTEAVVNAANETFFYLKRWMQHTLYHDAN